MPAYLRLSFAFTISLLFLFTATMPAAAQISATRTGAFPPAEYQASLPTAAQFCDSTRHAWLPFSRYNSDEGLYAGFMWNRYHYDTQLTPYRNLSEFRLQGSSGGVLRSRVSHERLQAGDKGLRIRAEAIAERLLDDHYYGTGNRSGFDTTLEETGWYRFTSWSGSFSVQIRRPASADRLFGWMGSDVHTDHQLLAGVRFHHAMQRDPAGSLLFSTQKQVNRRLWAPYIGYGLLIDSRNSETDPSTGLYAASSVKMIPWFDSGTLAGIWEIDVRGYYPLPLARGVVFAGRLYAVAGGGERPWWMLPWLGGEETLRGLPMRRYRGDSMVLHTMALRKWIARLPLLNSRVGVELFTDAGRVFTTEDSASSLLAAHRRTYGASVLGSVFVDDFIGRADVAFWQGRPALYLYLGLYF